MKQFVLVTLSILIAFVGLQGTAKASSDLSWLPAEAQNADPTVHSIVFADTISLPFNYSVLHMWKNPDAFICTSTTDPTCVNGNEFNFNSILKVCENAVETDCISSVSSFDGSRNEIPATFSKYTVKNHVNAYPADPQFGIPAGGMPSIWSIPGAAHKSGNEYAVIAGITGKAAIRPGSGFNYSYMQLSLVPVVLKDFGTGQNSQTAGWGDGKPLEGVYYDYCGQSQRSSAAKFTNCGHVNGEQCLLPTNEQGKCYVEEAFGSSHRFKVQLRLAKEPNGWMHGRMTNPDISIKTDGSQGLQLSVAADTTDVPMVFQSAYWKDTPEALQNLWLECADALADCSDGGSLKGPTATVDWVEIQRTFQGNGTLNIARYMHPFGKLPLKAMSLISPLIHDKSNAMTTTWSMRTLTPTEMNGADKCFSSTPGLKGIVGTNSVAYSAGPPEFKDGSLNYQVSSPHFNPDGTTPFKGNYNLVMRSDVARCIYGFSNAPIKASISVLSSDGNNDVATSVAAEKDGWISLSANNFQFSAPVIQVKFSQDALVATPVVAPTLAPTVAPVTKPIAKAITITCVKGKTSKKVTAVKPTCPSGFKKK